MKAASKFIFVNIKKKKKGNFYANSYFRFFFFCVNLEIIMYGVLFLSLSLTFSLFFFFCRLYTPIQETSLALSGVSSLRRIYAHPWSALFMKLKVMNEAPPFLVSTPMPFTEHHSSNRSGISVPMRTKTTENRPLTSKNVRWRDKCFWK